MTINAFFFWTVVKSKRTGTESALMMSSLLQLRPASRRSFFRCGLELGSFRATVRELFLLTNKASKLLPAPAALVFKQANPPLLKLAVRPELPSGTDGVQEIISDIY